ncbi:MAG: hypothetical protein OXB88_02160 [Bacteriovoracales bacterium]|nr:hypothetical protein [Bacteriovoracales bacterium]
MVARKKPSLKKALKKLDQMPNEFFGTVNIDISTLPCMTKPLKEKITANFDSDLLIEIKDVARKYNISYTTLINDVLRKVFMTEKKT